MLIATAPNIGVLSSDCGSTFHPLMKAQCDLAEDSSNGGAIATSLSATDCLRISVTSNLHQKCLHPGRVSHKETFTTHFASDLLTEGQLECLDL